PTLETERLHVVDDRERRLKIAKHPRDVRGPARAPDERVAGGVVVFSDRRTKPAVLLASRGVRGLPHANGIEVRERGIRVADALDDGDLPRVVEGLDALEVLVQTDLLADGLRLRRRGRKLRAEVAVLRARDGNDRLQ